MPALPSTHDETKPSAQMNLLDRLARTVEPLFATPPVHFIALLGLCAAYIQGGLDKLLDFNAAIAETQHFGLPFATAATAANRRRCEERFYSPGQAIEQIHLRKRFQLPNVVN
jgi:hypothetical protein